MTSHVLRVIRFGVLFLAVALVISGCGSSQPDRVPEQGSPVTAPTLSSVFGVQPTLPPAPTRDSNSTSILPPSDATVVAQATITALRAEQLKEVVVYDDALSSDWSIDQSSQTMIDLRANGFTRKGRYAIKAQPQSTASTLYFTLNKTATQSFQRSQVQAIRLYLSGGAELINNDALGVAVIGSNANPYWVKNDTSVKFNGRVTDGQPLFSETRLFYLGINTAIPRKTYVEVTVWLNSLLYDPTYTYVTGFYLKTDRASVPTFYVDQVSLLLTPKLR